jgi:hypothetical protein
VCPIGSAREDETRNHILKGMIRPFTVVPATSIPSDAPPLYGAHDAGALPFSNPTSTCVCIVSQLSLRGVQYALSRVIMDRAAPDGSLILILVMLVHLIVECNFKHVECVNFEYSFSTILTIEMDILS